MRTFAKSNAVIKSNTAIIILALCAALIAAEYLKPAARGAAVGDIDLQQQIPATFSTWRLEPNLQPIIEGTAYGEKQHGENQYGKKLYSQVLSRTYADANGDRVMLSIAYGGNQAREESQVHRPEICYSAQGFSVQPLRDDIVRIGDHHITVRRVLTQRGQRVEPLSYWATVGDRSVLPGIARKFAQFRLGLFGRNADGMLVRVSSIGSDEERAFSTQDIFLRDLAVTMNPGARKKYFGF